MATAAQTSKRAPAAGDGSGSAARPTPSLAALAAGVGAVFIVLLALQQALRLPSGYGVESWLGWSRTESVAVVVVAWCQYRLSVQAAAAYLLIDQLIFLPLYAALTLQLAQQLRQALAPGRSMIGLGLLACLGGPCAALLAALLLVDSLENLDGLLRLGQPAWVLVLAALGTLSCLAWLLSGVWPPAARLMPWRRLARGLGLTLLVLTLAAGLWMAGRACVDGFVPPVHLAWAHGWKQGLAAALLLLGLVVSGSWWFGLEFDPRTQGPARNQRAALRLLAEAVVGRSRYVMLMIAVYGALTLALDQCRDVLLALVDLPDLGFTFWVQRLPLLVLTALASGLFAHSCWLWTRLTCMVERPGLEMPRASRLHEEDTDSADAADDEMHAAAGRFARVWARLLALVPLAMSCLLVAFTFGDLVMAGRQAQGAGDRDFMRLAGSAGLLAALAVGTLAIAWWLVQVRRRHGLTSAAVYYNSEGSVFDLLWYRSSHLWLDRDPRRPRWKRLGAALARPWVLPMLALLAMACVRVLISLAPDAMAPTPPTLVLATLALIWWLGVLGVLGLWEQRQSLPWVLLPLAVVAVLSAFNLNDNHSLPWPGDINVDALREQARGAMLMLVLTGMVCWWAAVADPDHWPRRGAVRVRWALAAGALVACHAVLLAFDRQTLRLPPAMPVTPRLVSLVPDEPLPAQAPTLDERLRDWLFEARAAGIQPGPLYLVAAEGGGVRSAYWTAQVLARLHAQQPEFMRRTLLLSGVSGGSMGHALFRACWRATDAGRSSLSDCLDDRFKRLDSLSPLLGGLLFEDIFARVLPLARGTAGWRCSQPGCAHIDRAAAFEREWMRVFPHLAEPLQHIRADEPLLAFNSTWVETGNRTVATSVLLENGAFPAAQQLRRCLGSDSRLITAAHTSARFPGTNPLAGVHARSTPDLACRSGGHLIDGGYFDNSAVPTVLDVLHGLQPLLRDTAWVPTVILIRNGQRLPGCDQPQEGGPPARCVLPEVGPRTDPRQLDIAADRRRLAVYADALGPALALLNVSGVGSHGRQTPAAVRAALGEIGKTCAESNVWLLDQVDDGALVPLGWYLSTAARQALRYQVNAKVPGSC